MKSIFLSHVNLKVSSKVKSVKESSDSKLAIEING